MRTCFPAQSRVRRLEVAVVRRGDTNRVDIGREQLADGVGSGEVRERSFLAALGVEVRGGARPGSRRDRTQRDADRSRLRRVERVVAAPLEDRAVGFVEDHSEADHSGAEDRIPARWC